jgi:ferredoxin
MITIDEVRCTGCGVCLSLCPQEAIVLEAARAEIRQELCIGCGVCISACPERAIQDVDLAPVVQPSPGRLEREPALTISPARIEQPPTGHRLVRTVHSSPSVLERRRAVTAAAVALGPLAIDILGRLAERWVTRSSFPNRMTSGRDSVARLQPPRRCFQDSQHALDGAVFRHQYLSWLQCLYLLEEDTVDRGPTGKRADGQTGTFPALPPVQSCPADGRRARRAQGRLPDKLLSSTLACMVTPQERL